MTDSTARRGPGSLGLPAPHGVGTLAAAVLLLLLGACQRSSAGQQADEGRGAAVAPAAYSFFVAGHTYGRPGPPHEARLHPPFRAQFDWLRARPGMAFGVLTGDVVRFPRTSYWDAIDRELEELGLEVHVAPGNHDIGHAERPNAHPERMGRAAWVARYGPTYRSFFHGRDLFVLLDPNLDGWNISGDQLEFLDRTLAAAPDCRNLFVFCHQVIWSDIGRPERRIVTNSVAGRAAEVNFECEVEPRLLALERPVYVFAGDVGATAAAAPYSYVRDGDLHLVASGMGHGERDNLVLVEVAADGAVELRLVALNGTDPDALHW